MDALRPSEVRRLAPSTRAHRSSRGPAVRRLAPIAPVVLRLGLGGIMIAHGLHRLDAGMASFGNGVLASAGVPAAEQVAWVVALVELAGGAALLLGLATRLAAVLLALLLLGTFALVSLEVGFIAADAPGAELDLALLSGVVAVALLGPGRPSVDHLLGIEVGVPAVGVTDTIRS